VIFHLRSVECSILRRIWFYFMALCLVFIRRLFQFSHPPPPGFPTLQKRLLVVIRILCIKIVNVLVLHVYFQRMYIFNQRVLVGVCFSVCFYIKKKKERKKKKQGQGSSSTHAPKCFTDFSLHCSYRIMNDKINFFFIGNKCN
jgi:hypothetical protein